MNYFRNIILLMMALHLLSCATYEIEGRGSITPDTITGSETIHGSLYGYQWNESTVEKCETEGLFRVEHHTNALLILASVVTLGLYVPQTVEWWCDAPTVDEETEEEWISNDDISSKKSK